MIQGIQVQQFFDSYCYFYIDDMTNHGFLIGPGAEPEKLLLTATTNRTTGGVHAFCDTTVDSFALGSLATGDYGCAFGIALVNDGNTTVNDDMTLSFNSIQRSFRKNPATYVLEVDN